MVGEKKRYVGRYSKILNVNKIIGPKKVGAEDIRNTLLKMGYKESSKEPWGRSVGRFEKRTKDGSIYEARIETRKDPGKFAVRVSHNVLPATSIRIAPGEEVERVFWKLKEAAAKKKAEKAR